MSKNEQIIFKPLSKTSEQKKPSNKPNNYNFTPIVKNNPLRSVYRDMSKVQKGRIIENAKK